MATTKPKRTVKKTTATRRTKAAPNKRKKSSQNQSSLTRDIVLLFLIAFAVLLFLSLFGIVGALGRWLASLQFGLFGSLAYLFPILFILLVAFGISNFRKYPGNTVFRIIAALITFSVLCGIIELIGAGGEVLPELGDYYRMGKGSRVHGGFFGGLWCHLCLNALGRVGSYVVMLVLFLAGLVLTLGKALLTALGMQGNKMAHALKDENARRRAAATERRQIAELRLEERRQRREEERVARAQREQESRQQLMARLDKKLAEGRKNFPSDSELKLNEVRLKKDETDLTTPVLPPDTTMEELFREMESHKVGTVRKEDRTLEELLALEEEKPAQRVGRVPEKPKAEKTEPRIRMAHKKEEAEEDAPIIEAQGWTDPRPISHNAEDSLAVPVMPAEKATTPLRPVSSGQPVSAASEEAALLQPAKREFKLPSPSLLKRAKNGGATKESDLKRTAGLLEDTLRNFGVEVTVTDISCGPSVTRYELKPEQGVKVSRISSLADDIKLALAATEIRIEAPIPGKSAVGIEVPNTENQTVSLRSIVESDEFARIPSKIAFAVGQDIGGRVVVADLAKMPHLLIAGATGSGKSVCINSLITSILYRAKPEEVQLIMIDPKVVELGDYNGIPHLRIPVVTDPKMAAEALNGAVKEMTARYKLFADLNVRDIKGYNAKLRENPEEYGEREILPQIVIIVDEFADLMMVAPGDVEQSVCRLAQLARAAGIHLVVATQRPSVNVITGLIKANIQSRIALAVSSGIDSRTIIDMNGAEKLLGKGDMLFYPTGYPKPVRVQGCWVSDEEIQAVTNFWKKQNVVTEEELARQNKEWMAEPVDKDRGSREERDELFMEAAEYIIENEKASIGNLQRVFRIGFNRAARLMDQLADAGIVGKDDGTKARAIQMDRAQLEAWKAENGF